MKLVRSFSSVAIFESTITFDLDVDDDEGVVLSADDPAPLAGRVVPVRPGHNKLVYLNFGLVECML